MTTARAKPLLWLATAASLAAGAFLWVAAVGWPLATPGESVMKADATAGAATRPSTTPPLESFAAAWSRNLRQPLEDTRRATPAAAQVAAGNLSVRLVGTIFDPSRPRAIFLTQLGQMELRGVGEKAGGAEILKIDERSATLSISGQPVTLKVEKVEFNLPNSNPAQSPSARTPEKGVIP